MPSPFPKISNTDRNQRQVQEAAISSSVRRQHSAAAIRFRGSMVASGSLMALSLMAVTAAAFGRGRCFPSLS